MTPLIEEQLAAFLEEHRRHWYAPVTPPEMRPPAWPDPSFPPAIADAGAGDAAYWSRVFPSSQYVALQGLGDLPVVGTMVDAYDLAQVDLCVSALPRRYQIVVSCDLLEHVLDPFAVARNIVRSLEPGGWLYVTTVFAFEHHEYPIDMWRFTTTALVHLFAGPDPAWRVDVERCWYAEETLHPDFGRRWRVSLVGQRP